MQETLHNPALEQNHHQLFIPKIVPHKPALKLFIASDDKAAFLLARRVQLQLQASCRNDIEISPIFWNFALLRHDRLRQCATAEATEAAMIVISISGNDELPSHVKCWLESLPVRSHGSQGALVALLGSGSGLAPNRADLGYLRQIAANRGLDFFCNQNGQPATDIFKPAFKRMEHIASCWAV